MKWRGDGHYENCTFWQVDSCAFSNTFSSPACHLPAFSQAPFTLRMQGTLLLLCLTQKVILTLASFSHKIALTLDYWLGGIWFSLAGKITWLHSGNHWWHLVWTPNSASSPFLQHVPLPHLFSFTIQVHNNCVYLYLLTRANFGVWLWWQSAMTSWEWVLKGHVGFKTPLFFTCNIAAVLQK